MCVDLTTEVHEEDVKGEEATESQQKPQNHSPKPPSAAGNVPKRSAKVLNVEGKKALEKPVGFPQTRVRQTDEKQTPSTMWYNKQKGNALNIRAVMCFVKLTICQKIN